MIEVHNLSMYPDLIEVPDRTGPFFVIEESFHCYLHAEFNNYSDALTELNRLAAIPYGVTPNVAPCVSSATCCVAYELIEFDASGKEVQRTSAVEISAKGVEWSDEFPKQ